MKEFIKIIAFYGINKHFYFLNDKCMSLKCCQIRFFGNMKGVFCTIACSCWALFCIDLDPIVCHWKHFITYYVSCSCAFVV